MRILVVDEREEATYLFKQEFREETDAGIYTFSFSLNLLESFSFLDTHTTFKTLIIMPDIQMPGDTFIPMIRTVRENRPHLHIIIVTDDKEISEVYATDKKIDIMQLPVDFDLIKKTLSVVHSEK